jgi:hypothetical protein
MPMIRTGRDKMLFCGCVNILQTRHSLHRGCIAVAAATTTSKKKESSGGGSKQQQRGGG